MDRLCSSRGQEVMSLRKIKCVNAAFDTKGRRRLASLGGSLKFVTVLIALMALLMSASTRVLAEEEGRIQITFSKAGYGSGSGYLFYQGQKYGLGVSAAKIGKIWVTTIDLIGTASNLQSAADILGTYNGDDPKSALLKRAATARLKNAKGVVLEIRAVNLSRWSKLDLSGMTLKNVGWQSSSE
jgi:hypothetical protein